MTGPRRKGSTTGGATVQRDMMSVYPPRSVGPALGGYRSVPFSTALRIAANILGEANLIVSRKLTDKEWGYVQRSLVLRAIDPEGARPNAYLAEAVTMRHAHMGKGVELDQKNPDAAVAALAKKLHELDYAQAWAVLIACKWQEEYGKDGSGVEWWTMKYRAQEEQRLAEAKV